MVSGKVEQVTDKSLDAVLLTDHDIRSARKRSHGVLISGQVLSGVGMGATFSAGALLVTQVSGSEAWSGMAATFSTIGAAIAAIPLAALANRSGRAPALATGALIAAFGAVVGLVAAVIVSFPLLLLGILLLGWGSAVNLQSRFAATDLSEPSRRGRDLSIVVWSTTIGAVLGPNLILPADEFGQSIGLPPLSGPFVFSLVAQVLAGALYLIGLRPDPLKLAARIGIERPVAPEAAPRVADTNGVTTGIVAISLSTAVMVSVMSMTPVHLVHQGASLAIVGLTISLHVLGMFGLSPVFGWLADRIGREFTIAVGQVLLLIALLRDRDRSRDGGRGHRRPRADRPRLERLDGRRLDPRRGVRRPQPPHQDPGPRRPAAVRDRSPRRCRRRPRPVAPRLLGPGAGGDLAGGRGAGDPDLPSLRLPPTSPPAG